MFSTPLICSSIGATTVEATTSAFAPGYCPLTLMIGGAISGYCAIGSRMNDTPPRMMKTIDSTEAKIGRSMKKREIFIGTIQTERHQGSRLSSCRERMSRGRIEWRRPRIVRVEPTGVRVSLLHPGIGAGDRL